MTRDLEINKLRIPEYQQQVIPIRVEYLAEHFNPELVEPLVVNRRADGYYYVIDGLYRLTALKQLGFKKATCQVYSGLTPEEEMKLIQREKPKKVDVKAARKIMEGSDEGAGC